MFNNVRHDACSATVQIEHAPCAIRLSQVNVQTYE